MANLIIPYLRRSFQQMDILPNKNESYSTKSYWYVKLYTNAPTDTTLSLGMNVTHSTQSLSLLFKN